MDARMAALMIVLLFILGVIAAVITSICVDECKAWLAWLVDFVIERAVRRLPAASRERYAEEWHSYVNEIPGTIGKLVAAVSLLRAAREMSPALAGRGGDIPEKDDASVLTAHPLDKYDRELRWIGKLTTADLSSAPDGSQVRLAGVIHAVKLKNNKAGKRYATFRLEDREGTVECIAWPETYQKYERTITGDEPVVAIGKLDVDEEQAQIILDEVAPLGAALTEAVLEVRIRAPRSEKTRKILARLTPREEQILRMRLGIGKAGKYTVEETAEAFGITPEELLVIQRRVLRKLSRRFNQPFTGWLS